MHADYSIKPIKWETGEKCWFFNIKIANIIDTSIIILMEKDTFFKNVYSVNFTNCKWCKLICDSGNTYTRYGFTTLNEAKKWAEKEYHIALHDVIQRVLLDIDDYIDVFI